MLSKKSIINHRNEKHSLISLCNLELAFKTKAKSSALENYREKKTSKATLNRLQKLNLSCAIKKKIKQTNKKHVQAELFLTHTHN